MHLVRRIAPLLLFMIPALAYAQAAPAVRDWDATARLFAIQDSNAPLAANGSGFAQPTDGLSYGLALNGSKDLYVANRGWNLSAVGGFTRTTQGESALRDFDMTALSAGLAARRNLHLGSLPSTANLGYQAGRTWLGDSPYLMSHGVTGSISTRLTSALRIGASAGLTSSDFDNDGPQPDQSSMDSLGYTLGLNAEYAFNGGRQAINAAIGHQDTNAEGSNFDLRGQTYSLGARTFIVIPWVLMVNASHADSDYVSYNGVPQRSASNDTLRVVMAGPVSRNWSADLSWQTSRYGSNLDDYKASRRQWAFGLAYKF